MNLANLKSFLKFGYFLNYKNERFRIDISQLGLLKERLIEESEEQLHVLFRQIWYDSFQKLYAYGRNNVVPISGGNDSRAILATLREFTESRNIYTYTFGTPGTYDYEIGNLIASKLSTQHQSFSFRNYEFSTEKELEVSRMIDSQTLLFHHPPMEKLIASYHGFNFWSGCMLDWLAGSYLPSKPAHTVEEAKKNVYEKELFVRDVGETSDYNAIEHILESEGIVDRRILSYEEQIQIQNHINKYVGPHIIYSEFEYLIPALHTDLHLFLLALPSKLRKNQSFYRSFLYREHSDVFKYPLKNLHGTSIHDPNYKRIFQRAKNKFINMVNTIHPLLIHPHTNYIDFNEGIRRRKDLNGVIYENICDFNDRKIVDWVDIDKIYKQHMARKGNYSAALILLASLEINIKAGRVI